MLRVFLECLPISECPAFDELNEIDQLEPGFVKVMNTSGCCPRVTKICDPKTCPPALNCPDYYNTTANVHPDDCCPTYKCGEVLFLLLRLILKN